MDSAASAGQVSLELLTTLGFVLLIFIVVVVLYIDKNTLANELKLYLDAKGVAESLADNINTVSEQSAGYFRFVSFPGTIYGGTDYNLSASGNAVVIYYGGREWVSPVLALNVSIHCLDKGAGFLNRVEATDEGVEVTCHRPNLVFKENSFRASTQQPMANATVSVVVEDRSHVASESFSVVFNGTVNASVSGLAAGEETVVSFNVVSPPAGTNKIWFELDPLSNINESIESDNTLNVSWTTYS